MEDKLDKKRSHGTIYGDPNIGYFQDGKHYRHDGTLYVSKAEAPKTESVDLGGRSILTLPQK